MANVLIAYTTEDAVVLWTDGALGDETYSRRNIVVVGSNCVALHDQVEAWLGQLSPILSDSALTALPANRLANALIPQLQTAAHTTPAPLGVVVAGFQPNGRPLLLGLHSGRNFEVLPFRPSVIGGLPPSIWNYLVSALRGVPNTFDNVVGKLLLAGDVYHEVVLSRTGSPKASAVAVLRNGEGLSWLSNEDVSERVARNGRRLHNFHQHLSRYLSETGL